jgi:CheY-like chemotaxis protein
MSDTIRTALVVDDDPFIAELLTVLLESRGFVVDAAHDGIDAVELKRDYDVILLDLQMPVFDGERLTDYWQLTRPQILDRVIVLSGFSRRFEAKKLPTFASIGKPFDHDELLRLVEACAQRGSV